MPMGRTALARVLALCGVILTSALATPAAEPTLDFNRDVRPILSLSLIHI